MSPEPNDYLITYRDAGVELDLLDEFDEPEKLPVLDDPEDLPNHEIRSEAPPFEAARARLVAEGYIATDRAFSQPDAYLDATAYAGSAVVRSSILRSSIFSCGRVDRRWCDRTVHPMAYARCGRFAGYRAYQEDLTVALALTYLLPGHQTSQSFSIDIRDWIHFCGWGQTPRSADRLVDSLTCLSHARFEMTRPNYSMVCFRLFDWLKITGNTVRGKISGGLIELQDRNGRGTYIPLARRKALREGLQTWLAGWVLATKCDAPIPLPTLHAHSGSGHATISEFGRDVRKALDRLEIVGLVRSWTQRPNERLERNMITIQKARFIR